MPNRERLCETPTDPQLIPLPAGLEKGSVLWAVSSFCTLRLKQTDLTNKLNNHRLCSPTQKASRNRLNGRDSFAALTAREPITGGYSVSQSANHIIWQERDQSSRFPHLGHCISNDLPMRAVYQHCQSPGEECSRQPEARAVPKQNGRSGATRGKP